MSSRVEKALRELGIDIDKLPKTEKTETPYREGFESLVTDEEIEAIVKIKEAFDNYIEVHNRKTLENADKVMKLTPYARIQYLVLSDFTREAMKSISGMYHIREMDKKAIDEAFEDSGVESFDEYEAGILRASMMKEIFS